MNNQENDARRYIDARIRKLLAIHALNRISRIVEKIDAEDRKARVAVYIFLLLFAAIALGLYVIASQ